MRWSRELCFAVGSALLGLVVAFGIYLIGIHGGATAIDQAVSTAIAGLRTSTRTALVQHTTVLFSPLAVTLWTLTVCAVLGWRDRSLTRAFPLGATVAAAGALGEALKVAISRPRPPVLSQIGTPETTFSYPSGHVTGTTALVIGTLVIVTATARRSTRLVGTLVATTIIAWCVGTRLYLGVHWVTDVTAGVAVGVAIALLVPAMVTYALGQFGSRLPAWLSVVTGQRQLAAARR